MLSPTLLIRISGLLIPLALFAACNPGGEGGQDASSAPETDSLLVLRGLSQELSVRLDKDWLSDKTIEAGYNSNFGQYELNVGDGLALIITEEDLSLREIREELNNDQLFKHRFHTDDEESLVYESSLPDGKPHSWQFVYKPDLNGLTLTVRSDPFAAFNKQQIEHMLTVAHTLQRHE